MSLGIRAQELRKVYTSPRPMAAAGLMFSGRGAKAKGKKPDVVALDGLSLEVQPGEIFGLLGPNGAGKTTTVGILTTRVRPNSGGAWIGEYEVWSDPVAVKRRIGVVQQRPNLDFALTGREILMFHAAYFGMGSKQRGERAQQLLERFQLADRADENAKSFSGGMMQRLSIARAMMHDPEVLFLDEPSAGLDPQTRLLLWEIIREYQARGRTILLTTHNMEEADALAQHIAIVDKGKMIAQGTPAELKASVPGGYLLRLRFNRAPDRLAAGLQALPGVREVKVQGMSVDLYADRGGALVPAIVNAAAAQGLELSDIHISEPSLENLFLHHTGRSLRQ
jgi:ABC-2 type transport system ATP-binding protein